MQLTDNATAEPTGAVTGGLQVLLRLEGLALFLGMTLLYWVWDGSWWVYLALFLAPDLSFAGYLFGPRFGAIFVAFNRGNGGNDLVNDGHDGGS